LAAAALNGTIGIFTRFGFEAGATAHQMAFWKCFGAFLVLLTYCLCRKPVRNEMLLLAVKWPHFALLAFLGMFCLYFFETWAFSKASIPLVSFLVFSSGGLTIILSVFFLKEQLSLSKIAAFALIIAGVYLIFSFESGISGSYLGIVLALLAGVGYSLFNFAAKLFRISGGLPQLVWLFGFGSLYLLIPLLYHGFTAPTGLSLLVTAALVFIPTIGGFYFTTMAVHAGEASKVQIIETSDPLFATLFAFIFFGELMSWAGFFGAACILMGLVLALRKTAQPDTVVTV